MHGKILCTYIILDGNREQKMSLGRHKCRWEDHIQVYLETRTQQCGLVLCGSGQGLVAGVCNV